MTTSTLAAPAKGLSSVPKLSAESDDFAAGRPMAGPGRAGFAGTELVELAASLFQKAPVWGAGAGRSLVWDKDAEGEWIRWGAWRLGSDALGVETRVFSVAISAGTVGVLMRDPARRERNALNALGHETRGTREVYGPERVELDLGDGDVVRLADSEDDAPWSFRDPRPGRQVEGWSRKSRANMVRRLAQLDWTPMYEAGRDAVMVTFTYPGDWTALAPQGAAVKEHHHALLKRWARRWHECGSACVWQARKGRKWAAAPRKGRGAATRVRWVCKHSYTEPAHAWKLEFQQRGAPHLHLLVVIPRDPAFKQWLSTAWAEVIGARRAVDSNGYAWELGYGRRTEFSASVLAGTGVDSLRGGRCFDPKRAAVYFSKHGGAAGGKEYQNTVPVEWQGEGAGPGRFWGYRGLVPVVAEVVVPVRGYVQLRRTLRRWSQAQGMTRETRVARDPRLVDADGVLVRGAVCYPGEVVVHGQRRKVTRKRATLAYGGMTGGTVLVNDGPGFASILARHPAIWEAGSGDERDNGPSGYGAWDRASGSSVVGSCAG